MATRPSRLERMASHGSSLFKSVKKLFVKEHPLVVIVYQGGVQSKRRIEVETAWIKEAVEGAEGRVEVYQELADVEASLAREMHKKKKKRKKWMPRNLFNKGKSGGNDEADKSDVVLHVIGHACATSDVDVRREGRHSRRQREEDTCSLTANGAKGVELSRGSVPVEKSMSEFVESIERACGDEKLYFVFCNASNTVDLAETLPATKSFGWESTCVDQGAAVFARSFYAALVGMDVDQAFKAATESLYRTPVVDGGNKFASLLLRDPDDGLKVGATSSHDAGEGATLTELLSPTESSPRQRDTITSLPSFGPSEGGDEQMILDLFLLEGIDIGKHLAVNQVNIGAPGLRPSYEGDPIDPPPAKRQRAPGDCDQAAGWRAEPPLAQNPSTVNESAPSPPSSSFASVSPAFSESSYSGQSSAYSFSGQSSANSSFVETAPPTETPIGRRLTGIGIKKVKQLELNGIKTIEALAAVDLMDASYCMQITENGNPHNAVATITRWKETAERWLRQHRQ